MNKIDPSNWVDEYADYLYYIAFLKVSDQELAKDLVGDTFLSALQALANFRNESNVKTWLTKILNNKIIDFYRKSKSGRSDINDYLSETDQSFYEGFFEVTKFSTFHWIASENPKKDSSFTEDAIESEEFERILELCLSKLPPKLRPIFVSRFIEELESEEICKQFEVSSSNYWVMIHRAKLVMRSCLEKNWLN